MGLDGFSMGNLGLNADLTSAQMANQAEQLANKDFEIKIKDIEELAEQQLIKRKEEKSENNKQSKENSKKKEDLNDEQEDEISGLVDETDFENKDPKEFFVRVNQETEMIELFNKKEERILETISATDLMNLISKLDSASGILVNRKI